MTVSRRPHPRDILLDRSLEEFPLFRLSDTVDDPAISYATEDGGRWRFVEHADNGVHGFEGRYREVHPPEGMVQTFSWDGAPGHVSVVTTVLEALEDGRTRVVSTSLFHTVEERDGMLASGLARGLERSYAALDRVLADLAATGDAPVLAP